MTAPRLGLQLIAQAAGGGPCFLPRYIRGQNNNNNSDTSKRDSIRGWVSSLKPIHYALVFESLQHKSNDMLASNNYCLVESTFKDLNLVENSCSLSQADTSSDSGNRASHFSQLIMTVPAEINAFCLTLLWALKERGIVLKWLWEDGVVRVWADADLILRRTTVQDGVANAWLLRLIEASQHRDRFQSQHAEDLGTDFSFLCGGDLHHTMLQSA